MHANEEDNLYFLVSEVFCVIFRDCDKEAFGAAIAQDRAWATGVCRVPSLAEEKVH